MQYLTLCMSPFGMTKQQQCRMSCDSDLRMRILIWIINRVIKITEMTVETFADFICRENLAHGKKNIKNRKEN